MRVLLFLLSFIFLFSCKGSDNTKTNTFSDIVMTMPYRIVVGTPLTPSQKKDIQQIIIRTFSEIDKIYNKWNPQSELTAINKAPAGKKIALSSELYSFLLETDKMVQLTEGRFDPTVEPLQQLWKRHFAQGNLPLPAELETAAAVIGWEKIHFEEGFFRKDFAETQLDLGGIAKGYAIDLMVERLNRAGHPDVYVEWGGEIRVSGRHPEGRPWRVLVSKFGPQSPEAPVAIVELNDEAIASSGDYLQNWTVLGYTYCHIFDPQTKKPLELKGDTICSATVTAPSCLLADVLATTAMLFPSPDASRKWLKTKMGIKYWVMSRNEGSAHGY